MQAAAGCIDLWESKHVCGSTHVGGPVLQCSLVSAQERERWLEDQGPRAVETVDTLKRFEKLLTTPTKDKDGQVIKVSQHYTGCTSAFLNLLRPCIQESIKPLNLLRKLPL